MNIEYSDDCMELNLGQLLAQRITELKNNLSKYRLVFIRKDGGNPNFDLKDVRRIKFSIDGVEIMLGDGSTAFLYYEYIIEFALLYIPTLEKAEKEVQNMN